MPPDTVRPVNPRSIDQIVQSLRQSAPSLREKKILAGFDGFIDTLVKPVRGSGADGEREYFDTIAEFGSFISGHSHKSTSIQYEILEKKPGGNMPNFVRALDSLSLPVTAVGTLSGGDGGIDPLFAELGKQRYAYLPAGPALPFEFTDGKIFFSPVNLPGTRHGEKMLSRIETVFPDFCGAVAASDLAAFLNWSELSFARELWNDIYVHALINAESDKTRFIFFDLCDTSAKKPGEIEELISLIKSIGERRRTILSLNRNEALDINAKTGGPKDSIDDSIGGSIRETAGRLCGLFGLDELVIHQHTESIAFSGKEGMAVERCIINRSPKISTGAGDNFNAAYCFAALAALPISEKLRFANAYSSAYVAGGSSPSLQTVFFKEA